MNIQMPRLTKSSPNSPALTPHSIQCQSPPLTALTADLFGTFFSVMAIASCTLSLASVSEVPHACPQLIHSHRCYIAQRVSSVIIHSTLFTLLWQGLSIVYVVNMTLSFWSSCFYPCWDCKPIHCAWIMWCWAGTRAPCLLDRRSTNHSTLYPFHSWWALH